ncbi:zinc finger and SCAN domain-containing protein 29-like [Corticium candelabrum]|uniref:zinc finger and SCAN domain-containing protein 29-like n=1 Tax=Corticium candelabrum TaxID=121492 RepID=UPI002E264540|nr:zinc finger and SCAN domain-containing protein 29-like [Corticium candelabrum]
MAHWRDEETKHLVTLWSQNDVQLVLNGGKRNRFVFEEISRNMNSAGYSKTADQCKCKIKKLKFTYRRLKQKQQQSSEEMKCNWQFWEAMDAVLAASTYLKTPCPPIATAQVECNVDECEQIKAADRQVASWPDLETAERDQCEEGFDSMPPGRVPSVHNSGSNSPLNVAPNETKATVCSGGAQKMNSDGNCRKRKRPLDTREAQSEVLVDKMMKMLEESNQHHMRLEEKLLHLAEQMRQDSRDFQMHMMSLLSNITGVNGAYPSVAPCHGTYYFVQPNDE